MDREFYREKYDDEVYARADAWIRSEADLEIIELALIAARFAELASQVPDRVSRLEAAAREAEARRDPRERTIENECKRRGLVFERSTALSPRKDGLGWEWHFVASGRHFYALDPEAGVRLFDGTTGEPLD